MLKTTLQNVRFLVVTLLFGAVALFVIPVSAQKPGTKTTAAAEKSPSARLLNSVNYRSPGTLHKISVNDRQIVSALAAQGARVIADYGSYILLEANAALASTKGAQVVDENNLVLLNAGAIDTTTPDAQSKRTAISTADGNKGMRLIQFAGPIRAEWYRALTATGARVVTYIPSNSYLVYGTSAQLQNVRNLAANKAMVQWDGAYGADYRIDPAVTAARSEKSGRESNLSTKGNEQFVIQMVEDKTENDKTLALIDRSKTEPIISQDKALGYVNVKVAMPREAVRQIAERADIVSIQPWVTPTMLCERQDQIMAGNLTGNGPTPGDYLAYLTGKGYNLGTIASFGVNLSDSGLDNGTTTPDHFVFYKVGDPTSAANSRVAYVVNGGTSTELRGCNGHGNLNSSIIGGYVPTGTNGGVNFAAFPHADASGFRWGVGIAPFVKIGMSVIFSATGVYTNPVFETLESNAYAAGMRVSSNSWGSSGAAGAYNSDSQRYDALVRDAQSGTSGNQEYTIVFSAGNSGPGANTTGSPGTGKNMITVGAAENVNPFGGSDTNCGIADSGADNANDIISFSSRGPEDDGRIKPEVVGPGTHVSGAAPQNGPNTARTGNGAHLTCFSAAGVCGGPNPSLYWPLSQEWYTASSGTSHSCPAVAGTVALYRQYFVDHAMTPPSPALNKAMLINSSRYLNGAGANDTLPSNTQGMGEPTLNNFFDIFASSHVIHDESPADLFTASGQIRSVTGTVGTSAKPFRVTLVWTDPPGPTSGNAYINNLDLEVTVGGNTYKGNVFSGANSVTGGSADAKNNFESVFIPAGVSGTFTAKVTATNIAGDGVPGNGNPLDQDFALVVYNGSETPSAVVGTSGTSIVTESCSPGNGVVDPGETVTVNVCLQNFGTANTSNLVATLQASGGVTSPSGAQNYGALLASGAAVCKNFTFTASGSCGGSITATIHLQDGANDLGNVTINYTLGIVSVTPPALPSGWTADQGVNVAGAPPWQTSNTGTPTPVADTAPNAAFTQDPGNTCDNRLYTSTLMYASGAQLSFRQNFDIEQSTTAGIAYDAGVLEISINGGAYTDIITAGGSWVTGGYTHTGINSTFSNPLLPSRPCWSGISNGGSGGFMTTTANLPAAGVGVPVKLRWRMGSDSSVSHNGWRIDTVSVTSVLNQTFEATVCCQSAPTVTNAVSRKTHGAAGNFDVPLPLSGTPGIECRSGQGAGGTDHQIVVTFVSPVTVGGAAVTSGTGSVVGSPVVSSNAVTINLTGVTNAQTIGITLSNVNDGVNTGNVFVPMSVLQGDTSGNGAVSGTDVSQTKLQSGQAVSASNFREDVVVNGTVNGSDISAVKLRSGTALP